MSSLDDLIANNRDWSLAMHRDKPDFFPKLSAQQTPEYLWIGCADSRVPPEQIVGLLPGELFVHRNIANLVVHSDLNCLSVLQYAVEVLKVKHIIVCGHYGCGGVRGALENQRLGILDNWLCHIKDVRDQHQALIDLCEEQGRWDLLCELNVLEQVAHVCQTTVVRDAWDAGQSLSIHGWLYRLTNGLISDLGLTVANAEQFSQAYRIVLNAISKPRLR
ncbi:MAG: carbonate dehydratase [Gammaproteobacteria bacterium]|nr:carbonate dehydratase [Gammaproteobacteria bacterium]